MRDEPGKVEHSKNGNRPSTHLRIRRFEPGSILFVQGFPAEGVFFINQGHVKLTVDSATGRSLIVGVANAGDIIGVSDVVAGAVHQSTAMAVSHCQADYLPRLNFIRHLEENPGVAWHAIKQLSQDQRHLHDLVISLATSKTAIVRLARLFVMLMPAENGHGPVCLKNRLTHQEIAEMIGSTRETVTRALTEMRQRRLVTLKNGELAVHDRETLQQIALT